MAARREKDKEPRHVRLYHWLMQSAAWQDLDATARAAYVELAARYAGPGSNNGSIPCSVRDLSAALGIAKSTAQRALADLQSHGFVVMTKRGGFNIKHRHSNEWLLTEFKDDRKGADAIASKDFMRWRKEKHGSATRTDRSLLPNRSVPLAGQLQGVTMPYGSARGTVSDSDGSARGTLLGIPGEDVA